MLQKQPILVKNEIFLTQINKSRKILIRNLKVITHEKFIIFVVIYKNKNIPRII